MMVGQMQISHGPSTLEQMHYQATPLSGPILMVMVLEIIMEITLGVAHVQMDGQGNMFSWH